MIQIVIRQKGIFPFFKKRLPREVLLGDTLEFGEYKKNYLVAPYSSDGSLVLYDPNAAGRGIRLQWTPTEKKHIYLGLELPCHSREVEALVGVIRRVTKHWKSRVILVHADETCTEITDLSKYQNETARFNDLVRGDLVRDTLAKQELAEDPDISEYQLLQCALWPVAFSTKEAEKVQEDPSYFDWWLHKTQCVEAQYCYPDYWKLENGLVEGQYDVIAGRPHLLPYRPYTTEWDRDLKTGERMKPDVFRINFFSETGEKFLGDIPYDLWRYSFIKEKCLAYDACHFWMEAHTSEELVGICRRAIEVSGSSDGITIGE